MNAPWLEELRSVPWVTPKRWTEISGEPRSSVYDRMNAGTLPSLKLGERSTVIPTIPLLRLLGADNDNGRPCEGRPSSTPDVATTRKDNHHGTH